MSEQLLSVGKPPDLLYKQGKCRFCEIPLFGKKPVTRNLCGWRYCVEKDREEQRAAARERAGVLCAQEFA